jgi:hypothetical protein
MASELRVNTLKDAAGANSVALSTVANGSAKAWSQHDGATAVANDSFNVASITDEGTGDASFTYTSAMNNDNYSVVATTGYKAATSVENSIVREITTSKGRVRNTNDSGTYRDPGVYCTSVLGDLA